MRWITGLACGALVCGFVVPVVAFEPAIHVIVTNPSEPLVAGTTNLPDGTPLMVTIQAARDDLMNPGQTLYPLMGDTAARVQGGHFAAGPFTNHGSPFDRGSYLVTVTISTLALPDIVKSILGENGDKLGGPDVKHAPFGPSYEIKRRFQIN